MKIDERRKKKQVIKITLSFFLLLLLRHIDINFAFKYFEKKIVIFQTSTLCFFLNRLKFLMVLN